MKSKVKLSRGRRYTEDERLQAIRLVRSAVAEGRGLGAVVRIADQLGYGSESVRGWVRQADIDDGVTAGLSTVDAARLKELEAENRELRRTNDILRKASAFFAAELDRPSR
jgi:transposase